MGTLKAWDAINGAMGTCYAIIDGSKEEMIYVKNIEAKIDKEKSEIRVLGHTGTKHKTTGWKGTGSMTLYYATSKFRKVMLDYIKQGIDMYFELVIENNDPSSEIGRQVISLKKVNIDSISMGKLDVNMTELDEELDFTFDDVDILTDFTDVIGE